MSHTVSETENVLDTAPEQQSPQQTDLTVAIRQRTFGGALAALNASNGFTIEPTARNSELFHFCKLYVVIHRNSSANSAQFTTMWFLVIHRLTGEKYLHFSKQSYFPWYINLPSHQKLPF